MIRRGTISFEYYWLDRWYNIFRFHEPECDFRNSYCNINMLPTFENGILDYIDLDLDIVVSRDFNLMILDADEHERNTERYCYSKKIRSKIAENVDRLQEMISNKLYPFVLSSDQTWENVDEHAGEQSK